MTFTNVSLLFHFCFTNVSLLFHFCFTNVSLLFVFKFYNSSFELSKTLTIMKVRIIKAHPERWYSSKVGDEIEVTPYKLEASKWLVSNTTYLIRKEDCAVITDDEPRVAVKPSFDDISSGIVAMLKVKDKKYGNSALKPLRIFGKHHSYGSRIDEKLSRVQNSEDLQKNDVADILGGLMLICMDKGWSDFSDQLD